MPDSTTPTPQPPRSGARKTAASAGKSAAATPSALDRAKALAAQATPSQVDHSDTLAHRDELLAEIQTFEDGKVGLRRTYERELQTFDDEIAQRLQEISDIDDVLKAHGTTPPPTPPSASASDSSTSGADQKQPSWLASQLKSRFAAAGETHPRTAKAAKRVLVGKPKPDATASKPSKGTNI